jgi:guanylate kinase
MNLSGNLIIVSAPSGAGKTSLVKGMLTTTRGIDLSVSYTTRPPRAGEINGRDYHFVSRETFTEMASRGDFLESAEIYGNLYGTSQSWIQSKMDAGRDILLEIDWQGAEQVRQIFSRCVSIFILPPSIRTLEDRLRGRGKDSPEVIARRMQSARDEISHVAEFDYVIINDILDEAVQQLKAVVLAERARRDRQLARHQELIDQLNKR